MECPALAPVLKRNPQKQMPNMYPGVSDMLGFKVAEFTLQVTEPYLRDPDTGKIIVFVDPNSTKLVLAFAKMAGMPELTAKQAGDLYHSAQTAHYLKDTRQNLLTEYGVTAGIVTIKDLAEVLTGDLA